MAKMRSMFESQLPCLLFSLNYLSFLAENLVGDNWGWWLTSKCSLPFCLPMLTDPSLSGLNRVKYKN